MSKKKTPSKFIHRNKTMVYNWFTNLVKKQPVPSSKIDTSKGITVWETASNSTKNNFPQQLLQTVFDSPIGAASLEVWQEFVEGGGFVDEATGNTPVNKKETLNEFHSKVSYDLSYMWGCAIHIAYDPDGNPKYYTHLPFESTRLGALNERGTTNRILFNPYYGIPDDYEEKNTKWYYTYSPNPDLVKEEIIKHNAALNDEENKEVTEPYPGQVFWFSIEKPLSRVYPQPFYYSTVNWFKIDKEIQQFHERNIKNNFLLSVIINVNGDPDTPSGEPNDDGDQPSTLGQDFDTQMRSFAEGDGSALVNWFTSQEEKASIESFPTNSNHDLFIALQNLTAEQISIGTKVPRVLLSIGTSGKLGDTQEILNAIRVMQGRTRRMRKVLSGIYTKVFVGFEGFKEGTDFTIKNLNPINLLSDWVVNELSTDEKRAYIKEHFNVDLIEKVKAPTVENEPSKTEVSPEQLAAQAQLKGSVGGVQGILSIQQGVSAGLTSRESALEVLQLIYGFTLDEASRLLGTPKEEATPPPELKINADG